MFENYDGFALKASFLRHLIIPSILLSLNISCLLTGTEMKSSAKIMTLMSIAGMLHQYLASKDLEIHPKETRLLAGLRIIAIVQGSSLLGRFFI